MYKLIHITPCISLLRKQYQSEGQKHEAWYWSSFVEEFLSTNRMQNFVFRLWTNYNNKKKMLYNLNTNWKCVYIHRKLSLSEA